ncbi:MAG: beta-galactosidase, partial [Chthoniobacterales bacterium]
VISNDLSFDPNKSDWAKLATDAGVKDLPAPKPPAGMIPIPSIVPHVSFFSGVTDPKDRFSINLISAWPSFIDYPFTLQLGVNDDTSWFNNPGKYGILVNIDPQQGYTTADLYAKTPKPTGRFINSDGNVSRYFSYSYEPFREAMVKEYAANLEHYKDNPDIEQFRIADEDNGRMDYSDAAKERFHKWLQAKFVTIDKLNEPWGTTYKSFDEISFPKKPEDNIAAHFAMREFEGLEFVTLMAGKAEAISKMGGVKPHTAYGQASVLGMMAPAFTINGPLDYEDMINIGFKGQPTFSWDSYSTEDYFVGSDLDFIMSIAPDKLISNAEWNVHTTDPRMAARTYWDMVSKGIRGIATYQMQDNPIHWGYPFWALQNFDFTPAPKLAAIAQANHEIHHLEPLLTSARPQHYTKPIALYYSRMDLSLPQPLLDAYGCQIDSPYRVYGILRGMGYVVRWITPKQIEAGQLKDVGAVFMVDVKYVPTGAAKKLAEWVHNGGTIVGDQYPGIFDEFGRAQNTIAQMFGVKAKTNSEMAVKSVKDATLALQETTTTLYGVEPSVLRALNTGKDISKTVDEMYEQWDSTHPVALELGRWHLSGYGYTSMECTSGSVIGMAAGGPGVAAVVVNDYGKGHTLYLSLMMGTMYDAGPIRYEWDSAHEGDAVSRIFGAFLRYSGVQAYSTVGLPTPVALKTRIETPLVDKAKKNVLVGMISSNDLPLTPFPLSLVWPATAPKPKLLLAAIGDSQQLEEVKYTIKDGKLELTMPGFASHAMLLGLNDSVPLISTQIEGVPRKIANIPEVNPGNTVTVKASVWNPSSRTLPAGEVKIYGGPGWFCNAASVKVESIAPYSKSKEFTFQVAPPAICSARTLRPITLKYQADKINSTPATEIVWWSNPQPNNAAKPANAVSKN